MNGGRKVGRREGGEKGLLMLCCALSDDHFSMVGYCLKSCCITFQFG